MSAADSRSYSSAFRMRLTECMQSYLVEMINKRKYSDEKDDKRDLLSNLIDSNEEDEERRLEEEEIIGTVSMFPSATCLFEVPLLRKCFHVLLCWARGKSFNENGLLISSI